MKDGGIIVQKRKKEMKEYAVLILSTLLSVWMFFESILDLNVDWPSGVKWTVFAVLVLITLVLAWHFFLKKGDEEFPLEKNFPGVNRYVNSTDGMRWNQNVRAFSTKYRVQLSAADERTAVGDKKVFQLIEWTIQGGNITKELLTTYEFPVSLSTFTRWYEKTLKMDASLQVNGKTYPLTVKQGEALTNNRERTLLLQFPANVRIVQGVQFTINVQMKWKEPHIFMRDEAYFSDPDNYGRITDKFLFEIDVKDRMLSDYKAVEYLVDKKRRTARIIKEMHLRSGDGKWKLTHETGKMYVVRFEMKNSDQK